MKKRLTKNQINALSEYLTILKKKYKDRIVDVVLFGAVARGDYDDESDIDVLVIVKNGGNEFRDEISMASYSSMLKNDVVLSSLVMDEMVYNWHRKYKDPLYNVIKKEGINLWKRPPKFLSVSE
ncbi:MAG: nucleotidyltransferase domain-containing protein [Thermodesulfobacteriota bacterium]|nr:nucleotidyltransferase domain-containing protein [Thermodesulfobacteriota bacterium]